MARFQDVMPANQGWIHDLAKAEVHPDAERLLHLNRTFDPQQQVEESTIEFLTRMRGYFSDFARAFNAFSEEGKKFQEVKVYNIAQTPADFMVYRNQIKLVISNPAQGVIQLSFAQHVRGTLAVDGQHLSGMQSPAQAPASGQPQDLLAQIGPFRDVHWTFQGERVEAEQVARFYFNEFVRATRDNRRSRTGNQLLLEQIKTLLQEKGLEL